MELIDIIPNSMSFRIVSTLDVPDGTDTPEGFSGRVRRYRDSYLVSIGWYQDGVLHNPGRQHPAFRHFRRTGHVKYELWCSHGELQDPAYDAPAVRGFYADGAAHYEERWTIGRRQDGPDGSPAIRKWRADGTLRHERRYRAGSRVA